MAVSLINTTASIKIQGGEKATAGLASNVNSLSYAASVAFADGTGANKAQRNATASAASVTNGAAVTLDLTALSALGPRGNNVNFSGLCVVAFKNLAASNNLIIGAAASNGWVACFGASTERIVIPPGGVFLWIAPTALTVDGTHKNLKIDASAGTITYDMVLIGTGADS